MCHFFSWTDTKSWWRNKEILKKKNLRKLKNSLVRYSLGRCLFLDARKPFLFCIFGYRTSSIMGKKGGFLLPSGYEYDCPTPNLEKENLHKCWCPAFFAFPTCLAPLKLHSAQQAKVFILFSPFGLLQSHSNVSIFNDKRNVPCQLWNQRLGVRNWIALFPMKLRLPSSLSFLFYSFRFQNETTEKPPENRVAVFLACFWSRNSDLVEV